MKCQAHEMDRDYFQMEDPVPLCNGLALEEGPGGYLLCRGCMDAFDSLSLIGQVLLEKREKEE